MMVTIKKPHVEKHGNRSRLVCDILVDSEIRNVWFEVDEAYEQYLCYERCDAYVIGILNWCMREHHDIISEVPITEELYYNLVTMLIPSVVKYADGFHHVKIEAPMLPALQEGTAVATGCSCGVDSFYAIVSHMDSPFRNMNLTHLCINNVGAFNGCYRDYGIEETIEARYAEAVLVAEKLGLELVATDSNFEHAFKQEHVLTHTYSSIFAVYCLQKLWKIYYYGSSGRDYSQFSIVGTDKISCGYYELLSLQCFSISGLRIYSDGGEIDRMEKTRRIANDPIAQAHLHVCLKKPVNCNVCKKCRRTLIALDINGDLDKFGQVFDVEYYRSHIREYYGWIYRQYRANKTESDIIKVLYDALMKRPEFRKFVVERKVKGLIKAPYYRIVKPVLRRIKKS